MAWSGWIRASVQARHDLLWRATKNLGGQFSRIRHDGALRRHLCLFEFLQAPYNQGHRQPEAQVQPCFICRIVIKHLTTSITPWPKLLNCKAHPEGGHLHNSPRHPSHTCPPGLLPKRTCTARHDLIGLTRRATLHSQHCLGHSFSRVSVARSFDDFP